MKNYITLENRKEKGTLIIRVPFSYIYFGNTSNTPTALQSNSGINKYFSCSPSNTFNTSNFIFNVVSLNAIIWPTISTWSPQTKGFISSSSSYSLNKPLWPSFLISSSSAISSNISITLQVPMYLS